MGQGQSTKEVERRPPARPKAPPSATPISGIGPRGPSYHNPENKVLPTILPGNMQLRPVSQELSAYHPEYKDIFAYDDDEDFDEGNHSENSNHDGAVIPNGKLPLSNGVTIPNGILKHTNSSYADSGSDSSSSGRGTSSDGQRRYHRRQQSASSSLYTRENTITEEDADEERLEYRGKIDPLSSSCPHMSLPVKSTFNMDSNLNLTYAQLAEQRRNKTLSMIEMKTGKKIDSLSDDLMEHVRTKPIPNLVRSASTKSSRSTVSFENTDSGQRKKKKRAPAPPGSAPPPPPTSPRSAPSTPRGRDKGPKRQMSEPPPPRPMSPPNIKSYSVDYEPPADYDNDVPVYQYKSASSTPRVPPPPPPPTGILRNTNSTSKKYSSSSGSKVQQSNFKTPPVNVPIVQKDPLLLEIQKLAEQKALNRQLSESAVTPPQPDEKSENFQSPSESLEASNVSSTDNEKINIDSKANEASLIFSSESVQSKPQLQRQESVSEKDEPITIPPPPLFANEPKSLVTVERKPSTTSSSSAASSQPSNKSADSATRKLSSLLQHDIKMAAQAKITRVVKKSTPVKEKPKDPAEVFREQLAKAATERENRRKSGNPSIDEIMQQKKSGEAKEIYSNDSGEAVFVSENVVVKKKDPPKKETLTIDLDEDSKEFPRPSVNKKSSKQMSKSHSTPGLLVRNSRQRVPDDSDDDNCASEKRGNFRKSSSYASRDWTPEDDLESDDNLSDRETVTGRQRVTEGFKTSIIPNKVNDLKTNGKGSKKGKSKENRYTKKANDIQDDKRKFDSIKRFKKSVRSGVINAFGSISKAGGKMMKNKKSEDLEFVEDGPKNWKLTPSTSVPDMNKDSPSSTNYNKRNSLGSDRAYKYMVPNGYADHESESSDEEKNKENKVTFENGVNDTSDDTEEEEEEVVNYRRMKRAGVAYVSKEGQIVVLPEFETVKVDKNGKVINDSEGRAPKIYQKKKKFTYDATVRRKEREEKDKIISDEVKEKELQREQERKELSDADGEYKRLRELEARERLQKLETQAQLQQQLLQQQHILTAPPLPPPTGFQQGYNPVDYSQLLAHQQNLSQSGLNLPYASQPIFNGTVYNGVPNVSYNDVSDYMRVLGVQPSAPSPQQQYAFMLNSVNWTGQGLANGMMLGHQDTTKYFPTKSSSQEYLDRDRNQVFHSWVGPTKQPASKANNVGFSQTAVARPTTPRVHSGPVTVGTNVATTGSNKQRTNIMINDNESDISDGLSPQNTDASMMISDNLTINGVPVADNLTINGAPVIHTAIGDDGGHKTKISITNAFNSTGYHRQTSISSASSQPGSENSAER